MELKKLTTEMRNPRTLQIDRCSTAEILRLINEEDKNVPEAVAKVMDEIAKAVDAAVTGIPRGGHIYYIGAGTSGRIGILDASECPPTYGTNPELVQGIIAGGAYAIQNAVEGAEDDLEAGAQIIREKGIGENDLVVGLAASGRTPYVIGALREAKKAGAVTAGVSCAEGSQLSHEADIPITPVVGPEAVTGSTRMKAGTAQKLVLNMISTATMIRLGKVYGNLMIDMRPTNEKLRDRAIRIVADAVETDEKTAREALDQADGHVKTAIAMLLTGTNRAQAETLLRKAGGVLSKIKPEE